MVDPFLTIGIAANILQFLDLGSKLFNVGRQIHHYGQSEEHMEIELVAKDLYCIAESLEASLSHSPESEQPVEDEVLLRRLVERCQGICDEIFGIIEKLKVRPGSAGQARWKSFYAAAKIILKQQDVQSLRKRMNNIRQELIVHTLMFLRKCASIEHKGIQDGTSSIREANEGLGEVFISDLKQVKDFQEGWRDECNQWQSELIQAIQKDYRTIEERGGSFDAYLLDGGHQRQHTLIEQLHFSDIMDRDNRIPEAYEKTFTWVFKDQSDCNINFITWLKSDSQVYWITGKPGSGKSTLMKYICTDKRTFSHLTAWASPLPLVTAAFYFWNSGTEIQMSEHGLLRSLLFQILSKFPNLFPRLFPGKWESANFFRSSDGEWSLEEFRTALNRLSTDRYGLKLCLFVDGLDEFGGNHMSLAKLLLEVGSSQHVKICVASRPWNEFEDVFDMSPSLLLQSLTYNDIKHFTTSRFHQDRYFSELEAQEPRYATELIESVVDKASGVFLWVDLVVRSLLSGLRNGDRILDLRERLDLLPPDLENLYQRILDSLDPFYYEHAFRYFQLVRSAKDPPTLLTLSFADEAPEYVLTCPNSPLSPVNTIYRAETMRRRLNSRCKGLLEIALVDGLGATDQNYVTIAYQPVKPEESSSSEPTEHSSLSHKSGIGTEIRDLWMAESTVQYLHRTVKDFLEDPKVWARLTASSKGMFDPYMALCRSHVSQLKVGLFQPSEVTNFLEDVIKCIANARLCEKYSDLLSLRQSFAATLDELDRVVAQMSRSFITLRDPGAKRLGGCYIDGSSFWTAVIRSIDPLWDTVFRRFVWDTEPSPKPDSLLSLAVSLDFYHYAEAKIQRGCLERQPTSVRPLLIDAINHIRFKSYEGQGINKRPSLRMIRLLLSNAADPNFPLGTSTLWEELIRMIESPTHDKDPRFASYWLPVIFEFLDHGADPSVFFNSSLRKLLKMGDARMVSRIHAKMPKTQKEPETLKVQKIQQISRIRELQPIQKALNTPEVPKTQGVSKAHEMPKRSKPWLSRIFSRSKSNTRKAKRDL